MKLKRRSGMLVLLALLALSSCQAATGGKEDSGAPQSGISSSSLRTGAERTEVWLSELRGRKIGLIVNHTALIGETHLVDSMLSLGLDVRAIFGPEHGFRGTAADGETVSDSRDSKTGLPVYSLYQGDKKPSREQLAGLEVLVFDIQDVGARFYTFISTMHKCMEAAADAGLDFVVFDRPNPHGNTVDGPVLEPSFRSFVGMHAIPLMHGMTVGELAGMIKGENWLDTQSGQSLNLKIIRMEGWTHADYYRLPVAPSPNLPNQLSIMLYPSLALFEGTSLSIGRGTDFPFQLIGHPDATYDAEHAIEFSPLSRQESRYPKHENQRCYGISLRETDPRKVHSEGKLNINWLVDWYRNWESEQDFFRSDGYFNKLAGSASLRRQLEQGWNAEQIRASWTDGLNDFRSLRKHYLLYPEQ